VGTTHRRIVLSQDRIATFFDKAGRSPSLTHLLTPGAL
jgi:hypothetical protein